MNILLVGGYGFMGAHIAERFYREGWKITVIDAKSTYDKNLFRAKHTFYCLDVENPKCETIFESDNFDAVIYLVNAARNKSYNKGLLNFIEYAIKYKVKYFITLPTHTQEKQDLQYRLLTSSIEETLGEYNFNFTELKVGPIYGPCQEISSTENEITQYIKRIKAGEDKNKIMSEIKEEHFLASYYVEDVVDALYKVIIKNQEGLLSLGNIEDRDKLGWKIKYDIKKGIDLTLDWYEKEEAKSVNVVKSRVEYMKAHLYKSLPYIENIILFLIVFAISYLNRDNLQRYNLFPLDINVAYIFIISIIYGIHQGIISVILACISYFVIFYSVSPEISDIIYTDNHLIQLLIYILVAIVTSYVVDNKKRQVENLKNDIKIKDYEYSFLKKVHKNTVLTKNELESQILNSHDSLGKVYSYTKELNSLMIEDIYSGAISILEKVLKTESVSIYKYNDSQNSLRLICHSKQLGNEKEVLFNTYTNERVKNIIRKKEIYFNKKLYENLPIMLAPIVVNDEIVAAIFINFMEFEELSLYNENLFRVCIGLIEDSIAQAMKYEKAIADKKYYPFTDIITRDYFIDLVENKQKAKRLYHVPYIMLEVQNTGRITDCNTVEVSERIRKLIRETDYIGEGTDGSMKIILSNTNEDESHKVIARLNEHNLEIKMLDRVSLC